MTMGVGIPWAGLGLRVDIRWAVDHVTHGINPLVAYAPQSKRGRLILLN